MAQEVPLVLSVPAEPASVSFIRRAVRERLLAWHLPELVDAMELAASELATNAVLHACGELRVSLRHVGEGARLEVGDDSPRLPQQRRPSTDAGTGRGLALVAALASEWGVEVQAGGGKVVWATFTRDRGDMQWQAQDWLAGL